MQLLGLWPMVKFHPRKYGSFENRPMSETAASRGKIIKLNFDPLGYKESICATSGTLDNGQASCPNMAILKIGLHVSQKPLLLG